MSSKKFDQLYLSKAELNENEQTAKLVKLAGIAAAGFKVAVEVAFGRRFYQRLDNSAVRAGKSPIGYALEVLLK